MKPDKLYLSLSLLLTIAIISWITSCSHESNITDLPEICFEGDVLPIFSNSCAISACHDGNGESIKHTGSFSPMPKNGGMIKVCSITQFDIWVRNEMLNS